MMQTGSAALLFVEMTAGGVSHCYLLLLAACAATDAPASTCRLFAEAAAGETSVSMLLDDRKKQPTTSLASPSRAHRRVLAADRARHQPDAEAAQPTPAPLGRKQALIGANECDAHYVTTRRTMDASTATPGSPPDDASLSTLSSRPRPRRYRRKKHSMGRGFDAFLASKASKLARRRRDSSVKIAKSTRPRPRNEATRPSARGSARISFWNAATRRRPSP